MNFNISNNIKLAPFLTPNHGNKLPEGQLWFLSTIFSKNSHFNSFEAITFFLLIRMETNSKFSK
jgi:hypothetical protein